MRYTSFEASIGDQGPFSNHTSPRPQARAHRLGLRLAGGGRYNSPRVIILDDVASLALMASVMRITSLIELGGIDIEVIDATQSPITARTSLQRSELYSATRTTRG